MNKKIKSRQKRSIIWNIPETEFINIVSNSTSYSEILRKFNIYTQGSNINTLKRRIVEDKVNTSHIVKGMNSCKGKKFGPHKSRIPNSELFIENCSKCRSIIRDRLIKDSIIPYNCANCGLSSEWDNKPLSLVLDHINGIPNDNRLENLRFLCPNCNSQTETFAGRNVKYKKQIKKCTNCESPVSKNATLCNECFVNRKHLNLRKSAPRLERRKFEVTKEELQELLKNNSFVSIGKMFGVSDNAIRKRCKLFEIL